MPRASRAGRASWTSYAAPTSACRRALVRARGAWSGPPPRTPESTLRSSWVVLLLWRHYMTSRDGGLLAHRAVHLVALRLRVALVAGRLAAVLKRAGRAVPIEVLEPPASRVLVEPIVLDHHVDAASIAL